MYKNFQPSPGGKFGNTNEICLTLSPPIGGDIFCNSLREQSILIGFQHSICIFIGLGLKKSTFHPVQSVAVPELAWMWVVRVSLSLRLNLLIATGSERCNDRLG